MTSRDPAIDILRLCAALAVVLFHLTAAGPAMGETQLAFSSLAPLTRFGFFGVHLFFIISGFVIANSARGRTAGAFLWARCRRLYPAFWICCTLTALMVLPAPARYVANMTLMAPLLGQASLDEAYWTLYAEIEFYMFVYLIIFSGRFGQLSLFMALWLFGSAAEHYLIGSDKGNALLITEFCPFFVAGVLYSKVYQRQLFRTDAITLGAAIAFSALYAVERDNAGIPLADKIAVMGLIVALHGIMFAVACRGPQAARATWPALAGAVSYPLYLLHTQIGYAIINATSMALPAPLVLALATAGVLALAAAVHLLGEKPLRRLRLASLLVEASA